MMREKINDNYNKAKNNVDNREKQVDE